MAELKMRIRLLIRAVLLWSVVLCLWGRLPAIAEESREKGRKDKSRLILEEMVVTASPAGKSLQSIPQNVTVITAQDIENSTAGNIVDLLGREAGINIRGVTGNEGRSGVDIRGMGDTYVSNVIVMVDGFKLNASDMSGPDFLSVPLGTVERIEIIRGSGGVRYGNGAVGGVVNIITKRPDKDGFSGRLAADAGSYESYGSRFSLAVKQSKLFLMAGAGYKDSDGYRDNGGLRKKDANVRLGYDISDRSAWEMNLSFLDSKIGLPGPVDKEANESEEDRKKAKNPNDWSATRDHKVSGRFDLTTDLGISTFRADYRDRDNDYIIGDSPQPDAILEDTLHLSLDHEYGHSLFGRDNTLTLGAEFYDTGYLRDGVSMDERKNGDTKTLEWYVRDEIRIIPALTLSGGLRYSRLKGDFRDDNYTPFYSDPIFLPPIIKPKEYLYSAWVDGETVRKIWTNDAYELGLVWDMMPWAGLFASHSKSYRIPNVDELALSDDDLHPQTSKHYDAGARFRLGGTAEVSLAFFDITTSDEIYYGEDPGGGEKNRNYDEDTRRRGLETEFRAYPLDWLYVWGNYSYTRAKFEERDTYVPLVPKHMGNIGVEATVFSGLILALNATFSGPRFDGNDQDNIQDDSVLGSYQVFDGKLTWKRKDFRIYAGVKNIFNEFYATSGYSGSVYPMAGRSFFCGLDWQF